MRDAKISRRTILTASGAAAGVFAAPLRAAAPGRRPLGDIKLTKEDAAAVEKTAEQIKARSTKIFRV